jgi:hypothetical protein
VALLASIALALALGAAALADRDAVAIADRGTHLRLDMVRHEDGRFEVLHRTVVRSGLPRRRGLGRVQAWHFALIAGGRVLHEDGLEDPAVLRGEFHHPDDPSRIQGFHLRRSGPLYFSIRVPRLRCAAELEFHALRPELRRIGRVAAEAYRLLGRAALAADREE